MVQHSSRSRVFALVTISLLLAIPLLAPVGQAAPIGASWSTRSPIVPGREGAAGSFIAGKFYVSHGYTSAGGDSTITAVYDPVLNTWTTLAPASVARSELAGAAAFDGVSVKHYAIGGRGPACITVCTTLEIYDPITNTWALGAAMPTARAGLGAATVNNLIYAIGGRTGGAPYSGAALTTLEIYDPVTNTWVAGPPMPTARMDIYSVTPVGTLIYVIGGDTGPGPTELGTMDIYDTVTSTWLPPGPPMPTPRANAIAGVCLGQIFVIGGTVSGGTDVATVEQYDPSSATWSPAPALPAVGSEFAASSVTGPNLIMATGSGIFGAALGQNYALSCKPAVSASCLADGILVTETDATGGVSRTAFAESQVKLTPTPGSYAYPPTPYPSEPPAAQAHADARVIGADYAGLVSVSASTVYSKCDADAVNDPSLGLMTDAYGIGGAQDLSLTVGGTTLSLNTLDFEMQAFGDPTSTSANWTCDAVDVGINAPPPVAAICAGPPAVLACGGVLAPVCASVTVTLNEVMGPTYDPTTGDWTYTGSHLHVHADPLVAGAAVVDVYVGYVQLSVTGGPATPATYVGHTGCTLPICT